MQIKEKMENYLKTAQNMFIKVAKFNCCEIKLPAQLAKFVVGI